ncbi:FecR family protein [Pseudomonas auratipiscis]|uniref:FecR family protein n=1 Tax=Pseudomonas auratipiscis TaxID=3115853 RepID=A0AB35WSH4_9PSED|nr:MULTISPECIES: FecR family protein [unclassified Pseudomonas]MEE1866623.1 FecR family protein [Pseudomonas sp. 120P]MEE1957398.1 FecR family protein [Pseudomonas sp. 119P]
MNTANTAFSPRTAREAAHWLTLSMEGNLSPDQELALQRWRAASADNERAWQHIEAMRLRLAGLEPKAGYRSLTRQPPPHERRRALKTLLVLGMIGSAGALAYRAGLGNTGEIAYSNGAHAPRTISLSDGSQLILDADSEVRVQFDERRRLVHLRRGRILLDSGHEPSTKLRPLSVKTAQGTVHALGTRFMVELQTGVTHVSLFGGAVALQPAQASSATLRLAPGEQARFSKAAIDSQGPAGHEPDWSRGVLIADAMRLDAFLAQLSRYRPGLLRCSEEVASLHVSGVYPLLNSDAILDALPHSLPVQIHRRSNYWVTVASR